MTLKETQMNFQPVKIFQPVKAIYMKYWSTLSVYDKNSYLWTRIR